jgi:6-phosphogluconolactonase/glucosamine-6-phosphate isomerase/deaminase
MKIEAVQFFARQAWVEGTWAQDVLLGVGADGHWSQVLPGATDAQRADAVVLSGPGATRCR